MPAGSNPCAAGSVMARAVDSGTAAIAATRKFRPARSAITAASRSHTAGIGAVLGPGGAGRARGVPSRPGSSSAASEPAQVRRGRSRRRSSRSTRLVAVAGGHAQGGAAGRPARRGCPRPAAGSRRRPAAAGSTASSASASAIRRRSWSLAASSSASTAHRDRRLGGPGQPGWRPGRRHVAGVSAPARPARAAQESLPSVAARAWNASPRPAVRRPRRLSAARASTADLPAPGCPVTTSGRPGAARRRSATR